MLGYSILGKNGLINSFSYEALVRALIFFIMILLGMIYNFFYLVILLYLYCINTKMDTDLINAASDLGASRKKFSQK